MDYDNTNAGFLSKNVAKDQPGGNPSWPDIKGYVNVEGP